MKKQDLSSIMRMAWRFFQITGIAFKDCLKKAWANYKLVEKMKHSIVKFYFRKVDGSMREAYGTLAENLIPPVSQNDKKRNDTVQVYYDTERCEYRCFKKLNLIF